MRNLLTTNGHVGTIDQAMNNVTSIHRGKQPRRPHFIEEWMEARGLKPKDLFREIGVDKSIVSRWMNGASPSVEWQEKLAALFGTDPDGIFRHPDDDWLARFLRGREREEVERIKTVLEISFPRKEAS